MKSRTWYNIIYFVMVSHLIFLFFKQSINSDIASIENKSELLPLYEVMIQ